MIEYVLMILAIFVSFLIILFFSEAIILHINYNRWIYIDNKPKHSKDHIEYISIYAIFLIFWSIYFITNKMWLWTEYENYSLAITWLLFCTSNYKLYKHIVWERKWN